MRPDLDALRGLLERAADPGAEDDIGLSAEICVALEGGTVEWCQQNYTMEMHPVIARASTSHVGGIARDPAPRVLQSMGEAAGLIRRVFGPKATWGVFSDGRAWVWPTGGMDLLTGHSATGATPAVGLCIAAIKAIIAQAEEPTHVR